MLIVDFESFEARVLYADALNGRWVVDISADCVKSEAYDNGRCVGASQVAYDVDDVELQSKFAPIVYWAIKGLHSLPPEFRKQGRGG